MEFVIVAAVIIILIVLLIFWYKPISESFVAANREIWKRTKDPIWFKYFGDQRTLPRGYSEKDFFLDDIVVNDSWSN